LTGASKLAAAVRPVKVRAAAKIETSYAAELAKAACCRAGTRLPQHAGPRSAPIPMSCSRT
jgi:hypothetical protein